MKSKVNIKLFAILLFVFFYGLAGCSSGGKSTPGDAIGTVTGVVKDMDTGALLAGVIVSDGTLTATTDNSGGFTMVKSTGTYTLSAASSGYVTTYRASTVSSGATTTLNWSLTKSPGDYWDYSDTTNTNPRIPAANMDYTVPAWSEDGMNFAQDDYSYFLLWPPYVTLHVQVINRGVGIVTDGITVNYSFPKKTNSAAYTNFWTYAAAYGWSVATNVGITGTPLSGSMVRDANGGPGFVAQGIPVTPYDDDGTLDPYGTALITVVSKTTGSVLQTVNVVAPISTEMNCKNCHGTTATFQNILQKHDTLSGHTLLRTRPQGESMPAKSATPIHLLASRANRAWKTSPWPCTISIKTRWLVHPPRLLPIATIAIPVRRPLFYVATCTMPGNRAKTATATSQPWPFPCRMAGSPGFRSRSAATATGPSTQKTRIRFSVILYSTILLT